VHIRCLVWLSVGLLILSSVLAPGVKVSGDPEGFLSVRGKWVVDNLGQVVLLRGVNYPGLGDVPHSEADYATFASYGLNVVRLEIRWASLEPVPNSFQLSYLTSYVDQDVAWASKYGLYVVLEMAQFRWAERFGGEGVPEWTVSQYPQNDDGMKEAISNFWVNSTLQANLAGVWRDIAQHYANNPTIAGYDIFNEPWAFLEEDPSTQASKITQFYDSTMKVMRDVDPNHIFFLEPAVQNTYSNPVSDPNVVWSPHFYPLAFAVTYSHDNVSVLEADLKSKYNEFVVGMGSPMWIGEFGAFMKDNSYLTWLQDAKTLLDKYQLGWAWLGFIPGEGSSVPTTLRNPAIILLAYTVTVTRSGLTIPQLPPIPGFTWESILAGLLLGITALALKRRGARHKVGR